MAPTQPLPARSKHVRGTKPFAAYDLPNWVRHPQKTSPFKLAILFPGEQNSYNGALQTVVQTAVIADMFQASSRTFGFDVEEAFEDGPPEGVNWILTSHAMAYVADCISFEVFRSTQPEEADRCQAVAGFGVGEYAALFAAGVVTFSRGLELVKARAVALQETYDSLPTSGLVVRGVPQDKLERHMKSIQKEVGANQVSIAQFLPNGVVVVGTTTAIQKLGDVLADDQAAEVRILPKMHAGHTPLIEPKSVKLANIIERLVLVMQPPRCEVYLNRFGRRVPPGKRPETFVAALVEHISEPIQWDPCVNQMLSWGIRHFFECGPNRSLRFMMRDYEHVNEAPFEVLKPGDFTTNFAV